MCAVFAGNFTGTTVSGTVFGRGAVLVVRMKLCTAFGYLFKRFCIFFHAASNQKVKLLSNTACLRVTVTIVPWTAADARQKV